MKSEELTEYLNNGVSHIIKIVMSGSGSLREQLFILSFGRRARKAAQKRTNLEYTGLHVPAFIIASITNSCNLFCKGCYARANNICGTAEGCGRKKLLTAAQWDGVFQQAEDMGISFCLLAGGEPLLRTDVLETAVRHRNIVFPVFTNGTLFTREKVKFFSRYPSLIPVISIEGNEGTTDNRRGQGTFSKLMDTAAKFQKSRLLWGASVTVTSENLHEISTETFIKPLYDKGCRIVFFIEYVPAAPGTEQLAPDAEDRNELITAVDVLRIMFKGMLILSFPGDEKYMGGCLAGGRGFFHINPYGGAEPCPFSPYSDTNVTNSSLRDVLMSPLFAELNKSGLNGTLHNGGCALFAEHEKVAELAEPEGSRYEKRFDERFNN
jgi:MoaA/NifB/PqqE/SkfB family radical SAM enzyme